MPETVCSGVSEMSGRRYVLTIPGTPSPWRAPTVHIAKRKDGSQKPVFLKGRPEKQWQDRVWQAAQDAKLPYTEGPVHIHILVVYPRPKSWPKTKRLARQSKLSKPDGANLLKATEDPLQGIVVRNDSQFFDESITRYYGEPGEAAHTTIVFLYEERNKR